VTSISTGKQASVKSLYDLIEATVKWISLKSNISNLLFKWIYWNWG